MRDTVGSAAATTARCRKFRRGSFILNLPSHHSITSSAIASRFGGTSRPSVFAVLRLMVSSNLVGCHTGNSDGLAPWRAAPRRQRASGYVTAVNLRPHRPIGRVHAAPDQNKSPTNYDCAKPHHSQRQQRPPRQSCNCLTTNSEEAHSDDKSTDTPPNRPRPRKAAYQGSAIRGSLL